jgi:hypothetical protein
VNLRFCADDVFHSVCFAQDVEVCTDKMQGRERGDSLGERAFGVLSGCSSVRLKGLHVTGVPHFSFCDLVAVNSILQKSPPPCQALFELLNCMQGFDNLGFSSLKLPPICAVHTFQHGMPSKRQQAPVKHLAYHNCAAIMKPSRATGASPIFANGDPHSQRGLHVSWSSKAVDASQQCVQRPAPDFVTSLLFTSPPPHVVNR